MVQRKLKVFIEGWKQQLKVGIYKKQVKMISKKNYNSILIKKVLDSLKIYNMFGKEMRYKEFQIKLNH